MTESIIVVDNLTFAYEAEDVLRDISLEIHEGENVALIGANGAGKSTFLQLLVGLCPAYQGKVEIFGKELCKQNLPEIRKEIGYVFQDSDNQLFMNTVYDDIAFGPRNYGLHEHEVQKRVEEALKMTQSSQLVDKEIYKMSGGEKKLISLATVLALMPKVILFDEPTIALDPRNRRNLINLLPSLEPTKIIATHDLDMVLDTCERTILLANGRIIKDAPTKEILYDKELLDAYGLELPLSLLKK
ncbi:MAG: ABC transporter ATP-binding protein [Phascolarctobacterium sp.]|nr:ABC transporter ATP-binding protein [Phascolarctobacterium sp.]